MLFAYCFRHLRTISILSATKCNGSACVVLHSFCIFSVALCNRVCIFRIRFRYTIAAKRNTTLLQDVYTMSHNVAKSTKSAAIRISPHTYARLSDIAERMGWSIAAVANCILNEHLEAGKGIFIPLAEPTPSVAPAPPKPSPSVAESKAKLHAVMADWADDDDA